MLHFIISVQILVSNLHILDITSQHPLPSQNLQMEQIPQMKEDLGSGSETTIHGQNEGQNNNTIG